MLISRLKLIYPAFFQSTRLAEHSLLRSPAQTSVVARPGRFQLHASTKRYQTTNLERYGPAIELPPPSASEIREIKDKANDVVNVREESASTQKKDAGSEPERLDPKSERDVEPKAEPVVSAAGESHPPEEIQGPQLETIKKPLEKVLQMPAPSSSKKPPHLEAPPYVHHFDTYTLVKDLGKGGFTQDQSITVMKSVRSLLASNLELARDGLVSKSDVENVSIILVSVYLPWRSAFAKS